MKEALHFIVTSIVDDATSVVIDENDDNGNVELTIHANPTDIGKLIGKEGKVIRAIRNVMKILAMKQNKRIHITVAETAEVEVEVEVTEIETPPVEA